MGLLPAADRCDCQVCRPDASYDDEDRRILDTVLEHGWQVLLVGPGDGPAKPSFAYTIGLMHRVDHPELLMSGLPGSLMHRVLNHVAERVLDGHRLSPATAIEGALTHVPLLCEEIAPAVLGHTIHWSSWFHRRPVRGLQLVWPDTSGRFAWQPGAAANLDELQPPAWRRATARTGAFAVDPPWPLPMPAERKAFVCTHVAEGGEPIGFVAREASETHAEDWTFHCGREHVWSEKNVVLWHVAHVIRGAPSLREIARLGIGQYAWRSSPDHPWQLGSLDQ
jgi:hypothetical protein